MYNNSTAVYRPDIQAFLEQAQDVDKKFIFDTLFPVHGVLKRSGQYPRVTIAGGGLMRRDSTTRNATGTYNEITRAHGYDTYKLTDRGLVTRIDDDKAEEFADFADLEVFEGRLLKRALKFDLEVSAAAALLNESTFAFENPKVSYAEGTLSTIDFPYDMLLAFEKLNNRGVDANTIVLSHQMWRLVRRSKLLQDYVFGSEPSKKKLIRAKDISEAFSEETGSTIQVLVASTAIDMSNRASDTPNLQPVWGNTHMWLGKVAGGDFSNGGMGRTLSWNKSIGSGLLEVETWRDEDRRGDMLRARSYCDFKVIDETCGQLVRATIV